ncbi:hypothetical protein BAMA111019_17500 [Bacillus manliponensis]
MMNKLKISKIVNTMSMVLFTLIDAKAVSMELNQ